MKIVIPFFNYIFIGQPAEEHDRHNNPAYHILHQTCICYFQKTTYVAL